MIIILQNDRFDIHSSDLNHLNWSFSSSVNPDFAFPHMLMFSLLTEQALMMPDEDISAKPTQRIIILFSAVGCAG